MRYLIPLLFFALPAFAQTGPAGSLTIGDHVHDGVTRAEFDALVTRVEALEGVDPPGGDGGIPGGTGSLDCSDPIYLICTTFETADWDFFDPSDGGVDPQIVSFAGENVLQLAYLGSGPGMTGSVGYDLPQAEPSVILEYEMYLEPGFLSAVKALDGEGVKHIQFSDDLTSCNTDTVNIVDTGERGAVVPTNGCSGSPYRVRTDSGDFNLHPLADDDKREYSEGACTYRHLIRRPCCDDPPPVEEPRCVPYKEGVWQRYKLKIAKNVGITLWVDDVMIVNMENSDGAGGITNDRRRLFLTGYKTGHTGSGADTRKYYRNVRVTRG